MRTAARGLGELLITAGLVVLLFVAYQLGWTNYEADKASGSVTHDVRDSWARPTATQAAQEPRPVKGKGFAFLHIPRLGKGWTIPVIQGVSLPDLSRGVGHYPRTDLPGEIGNFAVAGHRATNGQPFANLDRMRPGDLVVAETRQRWFTYVIDRTKIVSPTSLWVLDPVPGHPHATPTEALLTLTTCNPRWASTQRMIVFGHLEESRSKQDGPPDALLRTGGKA
jgi:sortase A